MSPALQAKLLRVLQERQVVRLGSRRPITLDVRLVAATNVDLRRAVEAQHFRADLCYRLSVAAIDLPPLRERPRDVLPLAGHFMSLYAGKLGLDGPLLAPEAQRALLAYSWPGNIRELENVIHYALIVCKDNVVRTADCRFSPLEPIPSGNATVEPVPAPGIDRGGMTRDALATAMQALLDLDSPRLLLDVESMLVGRAWERCRGNQVQTARSLGVTRNTLRTLLRRHALTKNRPGGAPADLPSAVETPLS